MTRRHVVMTQKRAANSLWKCSIVEVEYINEEEADNADENFEGRDFENADMKSKSGEEVLGKRRCPEYGTSKIMELVIMLLVSLRVCYTERKNSVTLHKAVRGGHGGTALMRIPTLRHPHLHGMHSAAYDSSCMSK